MTDHDRDPDPHQPDPLLAASRPRKRSFSIAGHRTSISLEEAFWSVLRRAAAQEGVSLAELIARIDASRGTAGLSGAIRVWLLAYALRSGSQSGETRRVTPS